MNSIVENGIYNRIQNGTGVTAKSFESLVIGNVIGKSIDKTENVKCINLDNGAIIAVTDIVSLGKKRIRNHELETVGTFKNVKL